MSEKYELAYKDYKAKMKYKDIAEKYDVSINTVKSWKSRHWNKMDAGETIKETPVKKGATKKKGAHTTKRVQPVIENDNLTEQQKMFCLYYIKSLNITQSYLKAYQCSYEVAQKNSYLLMVNHGVKAEIDRLKAEMQQDLYIDAKRILSEYAKQASSDINDYLEYGTKEVGLVNDFGEPIIDEETGKPKTAVRNYVTFKESDEVDGTLVQEVKMGKDGPVIKLMDKQKAMEALMKYIDFDALKIAQISKVQAEAKIAQSEADKLTSDERTDDLLRALINPQISEGDSDG